MLGVALLGAGRIGRLHAQTLCQHPDVKTTWVYDPDLEAAGELAGRFGFQVASHLEQIFGDDSVNAVIIASATPTHVSLLEMAASAGKAAFCEKPIDLQLDRVEECAQVIARAQIPVMLGFNRRYDPGFRQVYKAVRSGEIGALEMLFITSRDPAPPSRNYLQVSGSLFRDMAIHDFDMARWLLGEEPVEVFAAASCLVDQAIGALGDVDTAMITLKTASGRLCHINNTRRATYGYDQRLEVHGATGKLFSEETRLADAGVPEDAPFFMKRYWDAYVAEMHHFVHAVSHGEPIEVSVEDGLQALRIAEAAEQSFKLGSCVSLERFPDGTPILAPALT